MDNFANIGKAIMLQSIGLQKNYIEIKETTQDVINYDTPACNSCKYHALMQTFSSDSEIYQTCSQVCDTCPKKTYTTQTVYKKIYHNEKNRYAQKEYKPRLKTNAIKLFLLLHFNGVDRFGIVQNINIRTISKLLSCDMKTVVHNLDILQKYNYISYSKLDTYTVNVFLIDYESYYLPAQKGGRGFFVMSKELLYKLLTIKSLVTLRIYIRELIDIDNLNVKGTPFTAISKSYTDIKRSLPEYCKPGIIKQALVSDFDIFHITIQETSIRFEIREIFECKKLKEERFHSYIQQFKDFVVDFNNTASFLNVNISVPNKYREYFYSNENGILKSSADIYHFLYFDDLALEDLAMLALQYSYDYVIHALSSVYKTYILKERKITNLGGLVRTIITASLQSLDSSSAA